MRQRFEYKSLWQCWALSGSCAYFSPRKQDVEIIRYPRPFQITPGTSRPALQLFFSPNRMAVFSSSCSKGATALRQSHSFQAMKLLQVGRTHGKHLGWTMSLRRVGRCNGKALTTYRNTITCKGKRTSVNISWQEIQIIYDLFQLCIQVNQTKCHAISPNKSCGNLHLRHFTQVKVAFFRHLDTHHCCKGIFW